MRAPGIATLNDTSFLISSCGDLRVQMTARIITKLCEAPPGHCRSRSNPDSADAELDSLDQEVTVNGLGVRRLLTLIATHHLISCSVYLTVGRR